MSSGGIAEKDGGHDRLVFGRKNAHPKVGMQADGRKDKWENRGYSVQRIYIPAYIRLLNPGLRAINEGSP